MFIMSPIDNYLLSIIFDNQSRFNEQKIGTLELDEGM